MDALFKVLKKIKLSNFGILLICLAIITLILNYYYFFDLDMYLLWGVFASRLIIFFISLILCLIKQKQNEISYFLILLLLAFCSFTIYDTLFNPISTISNINFFQLPFYFAAIIFLAQVGRNIRSISSWKKAINRVFTYFIISLSILLVIFIFYLNTNFIMCLAPDKYYFDLYELREYLFNFALIIYPFFSLSLLIDNYLNRSFLKPALLNILILLTVSFMIENFCGNSFYRTYFLRDGSTPQFIMLCIWIAFTILFMFSNLSHQNKINKFFPPIYIVYEIILLCITLKALNFKLHSQITEARIVALVDCILLLILLIGILINYTGFLLKKKELQDVQKWILSMIPVFLIWIVLMADILNKYYPSILRLLSNTM